MSTPTPIERARTQHPAGRSDELAKAAAADTLARLTAIERLRRVPRVGAVLKASEAVEGPCRTCEQLRRSENKSAQEAHAVQSAREAEQMARELGLESKVARRAAEIAYTHHGGTVGMTPKALRKADEKGRRSANAWLAKEIRKRMGQPKPKKGATWRAWIQHRNAGGRLTFDEFKRQHKS